MLAKDKQKHFFAGLAIAIIAGPFLYIVIAAFWSKLTIITMAFFGLIFATIAGAIKEIVWDWWWKKGTPEWLDFWATVLGGFVGYLILL